VISRARAAHKQLWRLQQCNELTDSRIRNDRRITTSELAPILGIGKGSVDKIFH
jgi:hypothetical protein